MDLQRAWSLVIVREVSQSTNYDTSKLVYFDFNLSGTVAFLRNSVLEMGSAAPNTISCGHT